MTANQIAYWNLQENIRSHKANEQIGSRQAGASERTAASNERNSYSNQLSAYANSVNAKANTRNAESNWLNAQTRTRELDETIRHNQEAEVLKGKEITTGALVGVANAGAKALSMFK